MLCEKGQTLRASAIQWDAEPRSAFVKLPSLEWVTKAHFARQDSRGRLSPHDSVLASCLWIDLENAERVSFWIHEVSLPAGVRDGELGQSHDAAQIEYGFCGCVEVIHLRRTYKCVCAGLRWRCWRGTFEQTSTRSASFNRPVRNRKPRNLGEFPAENLRIEVDCASGIVSLNFEIHVTFAHACLRWEETKAIVRL